MWTLSTKRRGCYIYDLHTLLGSTLDSNEVYALQGPYRIYLKKLGDIEKKDKVEWKVKDNQTVAELEKQKAAQEAQKAREAQ